MKKDNMKLEEQVQKLTQENIMLIKNNSDLENKKNNLTERFDQLMNGYS
jgi:predicted nuclease with TOPRIM domain